MLGWPNARLIFLREVRDQLRDRRTLFIILVLPMILYPALGFGMVQLMLQLGAKTKHVGIIGLESLKEVAPPVVDETGQYFHGSLFARTEDQQKLVIQQPLAGKAWSTDALRSRTLQVLVEIPPNLADDLANDRRVTLKVQRNAAEDDSEFAYRSVINVLRHWEDKIVQQRLQRTGQSSDLIHPVIIDEEQSDISLAKPRSGNTWGRILPFILVLMALTGAFYPAIDVCAGEKERGTMETLLITPSARGEIVLGKFLTVFVFSVATSLCHLGSMGLTFGQLAAVVSRTAKGGAQDFSAPTLTSIVWMLVLLAPLAAFFSSLCLAMAAYARSTKEGQHYLTPLFTMVMPLVFLTLAPGVRLTPFTSLIPVTNVTLLLRSILMNEHEEAMIYLLPVLLPTCMYGYLALRFARDQFHREDVMFRDAEPFNLKLWSHQLFREREALPTSVLAWVCFVVMVSLIWYIQPWLPKNIWGLTAGAQFPAILLPTVLLALLLTRAPVASLGWCRPQRWGQVGWALALALMIHPVMLGFNDVLLKWYPPSQHVMVLREMINQMALWQKLLLLAVVPALCEETAFRGFILAGLRQKHPPTRAIVISSVLFGVYHQIPQQMITAILMGLVLGVIATRAGSIWPGVVFHALHNAIMLWTAQAGPESRWTLIHQPTALVVGALGAAVLLVSWIRFPPAARPCLS